MSAANPTSSPPRRRRIRRLVTAFLILMALALLFLRWATEIRQSGVRAQHGALLHSVSQAAALHQQNSSAPATLDSLIAAGLVDRTLLRRFSRCEPAGPSESPVHHIWLVQTKPCRAVKKGEAWGGPGETIDHDLPACRYLLMKDWTVRQVDEPDYQRDFAPHIRLKPL